MKVMRMSVVLFALATTCLFNACSQSQEKSPTHHTGKPSGDATAPTSLFRFSQAGMVTGRSTAGNWCYRSYTEAVLVSAPPDNSNRRFFDAQPGIYKIIVPIGKVTAAVLLRSFGGSQPLEIHTSDHFPECLSNAANFRLNAEGTVLSYDNGENIRFTASAQPNGPAMRVSFDLPVGLNYGIEVRLCDNCED
jgi:hypothetical protein